MKEEYKLLTLDFVTDEHCFIINTTNIVTGIVYRKKIQNKTQSQQLT